MNNRICPVCSCSEVSPLYVNKMEAISGYDMSYNIGRCNKCAFLFASTIAENETVKSYYLSCSKYDISGEISWLDNIRIKEAIKFVNEVSPIPVESMIVDLGCGFGALLSGFKGAGYTNIYGIDPAQNVVKAAYNLFGLENIFCSTLADAQRFIPLNNADLVCLTGVLEHLPNLHADIANLIPSLKNGCKILVEVPAFLEQASKMMEEPFGEFSLEHLQYFTSISLRNFFRSLGVLTIGFKVVELPVGAGNSLFGMFEVSENISKEFELLSISSDAMEKYIEDSQYRLDIAFERIPDGSIVIYGAGSHTARILPHIEKMPNVSVLGVVDSNPNLLNKTVGKYIVKPPSAIASMPEAHILVSSFRYQNEIAKNLRELYPNPLVLLYE